MKVFRSLAFIVLALVVVAGCRKKESPEGTAAGNAGQQPSRAAESGATEGVEVGRRMPAYEAKMADGSPFQLAARRDKVVLLNIWATWCGPCRYEIPELQAMHQKLGPRGFEVIGVSIDDPGSEQTVRDFVQREKIAYPIVLDPQGKIADLFQTTVIPTSALIGRDGTILWLHRGIVSAQDERLNSALEKAL